MAVESWNWIPFSKNRDFGLSEDWNFSKKLIFNHENATGLRNFIPLSRAVLKEILKTQKILNKIFFLKKWFQKWRFSWNQSAVKSDEKDIFCNFLVRTFVSDWKNSWKWKNYSILDKKIHPECCGKISLVAGKQL